MKAESPVEPGLLVFRLASRLFGVTLTGVREILRMVAVTPLPGAPHWVVGVLDLRGSHIPVIDLRAHLGITAAPPDPTSRIIVLDAESPCALVVDEVVEVVTDAPEIERVAHELDPVLGVARVGAGTVVVLDLGSIVAATSELDIPEDLDALV